MKLDYKNIVKDAQAFKIINKRLINKYIQINWMTTEGETFIIGKVWDIKVGNSLKDVSIFPLNHRGGHRPGYSVDGLHENCYLRIRLFKDEKHARGFLL